MEHISIKKQERGKGVILGGGRHFSFDRQIREELTDFGWPHFGRVPLAVKYDVLSSPVEVGLSGAITVVACADEVSHLLPDKKLYRFLESRRMDFEKYSKQQFESLGLNTPAARMLADELQDDVNAESMLSFFRPS